jgi:multicomponent Na+:H+ antiporter subunit D
MDRHLPALVVITALIGAPLCLLVRQPRAVWALFTAITWSIAAMAISLLVRVLGDGPVRYAMGGWSAPLGIEFRIDALGGFVLMIVASMAAVVAPYSLRSVEREIPASRIHQFYAVLLLALTGLLGLTATGDIFNAFVFLEVSSLATYVLVSLGRDRRALVSAFRYLVMGTVGGTFYLIGVGFLYVQTGTLNMQDLAATLPQWIDTRTSAVAFAFLTVGLSLKLALFPVHLWLPGAYSYAPSVVSAFLAATATKVAVYLMLRVFFTVFGEAVSFGELPVAATLPAVGLFGALAMSLVAVFQTNLKRLLAYSSIAQIGYIVMAISLGTQAGLTAGIGHLFNHALMKGALFLAVGCVVYRLGSVRLEEIRGLGRRMPWTAAAIFVGGASLVGMPLTAGFISKWHLVSAILAGGQWGLVALILTSSLLAVAYVWRVVAFLYLREAPSDALPAGEAPWSMLAPTWALVLANVWFGLDTRGSLGIAAQAAASLLGGQP